MAEYLIQEETLTGIAEAIRSKTGSTDPIAVGDMASIINSFAENGSSKDVCYVTFMSYDGSVEYGKKAVAVGDDCADPIARGIFDKPTKESTEQYTYAFAGWATTPNGGLNSNALKAVEENRTVYANFTSHTRVYTITFYNGDPDASSQYFDAVYCAYGETPVPYATPERSGFTFDGWEPEIVPATCNTSYTAVWKTKATFETATWEEIAAICDAGNAASTFAIGDSKPVTLTYTDGTTETINFRIVDMDADTKEDGTTAAITLLADNLVKNSVQPATSLSDTKADIQNESNMNKFMTTLENALPADLAEIIKPVKKYYNYFSNTYRTLFIPSRQNLDGSTTSFSSDNTIKFPQKQYAYFANGNSIKRTKLSSASSDDYWTNTAGHGSTSGTVYYGHYYVDGNSVNVSSQTGNQNTHGVLFGFCI